MTATVGLVLTTFGVADGGRRAKCRTRTGRGMIEVIAEVPPGFDVRTNQEVDLEHSHGDVWVIKGHAVDVSGPFPAEPPRGGRITPQENDPAVVREMVKAIVSAFGPCPIRVYETDAKGTRWCVGSNDPKEQEDLKAFGGRMAVGGVVREG